MSGLDLPTIIVLVAINGIVDAAGVSYLAGWWSKRRMESWLTSKESDPYIARIVDRVAAAVPTIPPYPEVPSVEAVSQAVLSKLPPYPEIPDLRADVTEVLERRTEGLAQRLKEETGQMLRAYMAAQEAKNAAFARELAKGTLKGDPQSEFMMRLITKAAGKEAAETVALLREGLHQMKAYESRQKGGSGSNGGYGQPALYQPGTVLDTNDGRLILTSQGQWVPLMAPQAMEPSPQLAAPSAGSFAPPKAKEATMVERVEADAKPAAG